MPGNIHNTNTISATGMAVLVGIILTIGPWFTQIGFFSKIGVSIVGIILILLGINKG